MLPASSSTPSPSASRVPRARPARRADRERAQAWIAGALVLYALLLAIGLFTHIIRPERAFLLIAAPCLVPMLRYAFDYRQNRGERDSGLLLSAVGWFLIILALAFKQIAVIQAGGNLAALAASSPLVPICATFGVLCLLTGAVFSWLFWAAGEEVAEPPASVHY